MATNTNTPVAPFRSLSVFDLETLTSTAHPFADGLKIDVASKTAALDADGVTYSGKRIPRLDGERAGPGAAASGERTCVDVGPFNVQQTFREVCGMTVAWPMCMADSEFTPTHIVCPALPDAVLGMSFGSGLIVYQIAPAAAGGLLARIEIGRTSFRHIASPSCVSSLLLSPRHIFILESPLSFNLNCLLGLASYDSDDDVATPNCRNYYCLQWDPEVRCERVMDRGPIHATRVSADVASDTLTLPVIQYPSVRMGMTGWMPLCSIKLTRSASVFRLYFFSPSRPDSKCAHHRPGASPRRSACAFTPSTAPPGGRAPGTWGSPSTPSST